MRRTSGGSLVVAFAGALRRYVGARQLRARARRRRDELETRLADAGVDPDDLTSLARLADQVARCDPERAEALELESLLDRYADAAIALARHRRVLDAIDVGRLQRLRAVLDGRSPRGALVARRLAFWAECEQRRRRLEEAISAIHELFGLAAQQALAGPGGASGDGDAIQQRLAYLDALDEL